MYTTAKKRNVMPATGLQQKKRTANQTDFSNCYDLSKNDLRIQYHSQNKTTPNVIQRKLFVDGNDAKGSWQAALKAGFDSNYVYYSELIINYLDTCKEEFEVNSVNLNAFVLCVKNCLKEKMGKLRESFIQEHIGPIPEDTPNFIKKERVRMILPFMKLQINSLLLMLIRQTRLP